MLKGFKVFIMRGNVIDLAVAVVIGAAFNAVVSALVADIFTPFIAAIIGKPNFANLTFTINHSHFLYGLFINALVSFLAVALAVYLFVVYPLNKLAERRARNKSVPAVVPPDVALLSEIRDLLAQQVAAGSQPAGGEIAGGGPGSGGLGGI
ncbi:MAG TPA: large conductance mechanosensitive channel protein MscL [Acidimicrobiales bacterium]|nr:large conductance mechanosensitive channel protein MscL [Acidimicrobiales bacterium]